MPIHPHPGPLPEGEGNLNLRFVELQSLNLPAQPYGAAESDRDTSVR
jgi:hypothetical protein